MTEPAAPDRAEIRAARKRLKLTQQDAAALIFCGRRAWMEWEAGRREMHPALWELFLLKAGKQRQSAVREPLR